MLSVALDFGRILKPSIAQRSHIHKKSTCHPPIISVYQSLLFVFHECGKT
ncbi:hypothetical protein AB205_0092510 [Aquarana catesbeiana]|uniref:Uncharacterized protein n=1 Tax=Aquarana catesbeiana TaxID=8400 RepID=A0A2G9NIR0_AQUCT|nr:hypothetical protein AB205_0092510 [Aquarana catesbeiana]